MKYDKKKLRKTKVQNIILTIEVRARDVQTLFADLSTGAHSPSLISQGRIGQLVTKTYRENHFEAAAGISESMQEDMKLKLG